MFYNHPLKITPTSRPLPQRGFGLVELLVSISIVVLVTGVILTRQSSFNGAILLRNQAYEVAFAIRQAQLQAVSGTDESAMAVGTSQQYGIYFDSSTASKRSIYTSFRDVNGSGRYDTGDTDGQVGKIDPRFEIRKISYQSGTSLGSNLSVTFRRPNFDALFKVGNTVIPGPVYIDIAKVGDPDNGSGDVRRVEITSAGQIDVVNY